MRTLYIVPLLICSWTGLIGQSNNSNFYFNSQISDVGSVKIQKKNNELSVPILNFRKNEQLLLRFDMFDANPKDLAYEVILCDKDWKQTALDKYDYIDGYETVYIREFNHSINTLISYMNYQTEIPSEDFSFKMSGNYVVRIFNEDEPKRTILQRRFIVTESEINVDAKIIRPQVVEDSRYKQQVEFNISYPEEISDPLTNLYVVVRQNRNWSTAIINAQADYVKDNKLYFNDYTKFTFDGNDEFRQIDLKFNRSGNLEVGEIIRKEGQYQVYLKVDKPKSFDSYIYKEDLNGKFTIKNDEAQDQDTEADYFNVHFELNQNFFFEGDVYVFGEISGWVASDDFKMQWDADKKRYTLNRNIKQGMVNFYYALLTKSDGKINIEKIEGNHFETENDYDIILYYRDIRRENDRVLGVYSFNSLY